jgi:hypothetical protein
MTIPILTTERLVLRPFDASDLDSFADMNTDPAVVAFLGNGIRRQNRSGLWARQPDHRL